MSIRFSRNARFIFNVALRVSVLPSLLFVAVAQEQTRSSDQAALQATFQLASNFTGADEKQRESVLGLLVGRQSMFRQEEAAAHATFNATPDIKYRSLAPADAAEAYAYIRALRKSYARYQGAQLVGDRDWAPKQLKAAQEYAELAANSLLAESQQDEHDLADLQRLPFAARRPPADQIEFVAGLKKSGLSPELRKLLLVSGQSEAEVTAFQQEVVKLAPERIGTSPVELLLQIAAARRALVAELRAFTHANPGGMAGVSAQTFAVSNPHDKPETVDLFIRPVSIPADWKLSVVDGEEQATPRVREIEAGKHYALTLPPKAQVNVASVVVPVGDVGTNTTARWAVEGKIGDELIGGMVLEMNVPNIIADLQLPPVGSKELEEELFVPSRNWARIIAEVVGGAVMLGLLAYFFMVWRGRRQTNTRSAP